MVQPYREKHLAGGRIGCSFPAGLPRRGLCVKQKVHDFSTSRNATPSSPSQARSSVGLSAPVSSLSLFFFFCTRNFIFDTEF